LTNVVFFEGFDSGPGDDLWETNGTVSGTFAIGGIANAGVVGASAGGLGPIFDLAAFGDGVLFQGFDANSGYGLWTSNGTAAGTVEIGGLDNAGVTGAYSQGLDPSSITVLGGQAIFLGDDSNYASKYAQSLWMTDGTNSGTTEIGGLGNAGIADKYASGWNPAGFTAIGGEVFFTATDSVDYTGIWVTNGAAAGTIEIGGLKNAGIAGAPTTAFEPSAFLSLGSKALFENSGLWVSNGTAAGTTEISTVVGLDLTVVGNEGYFSGDDSSGDPTLWETNGTAAGTIEIGGVANAGVSGADSKGLNPCNFTALGNEVVFTGSDASGAQILWITNGSATGTVEIGGLANAGVNGAVGASGLAPQTFASLGDNVLFTGQDSSGQWASGSPTGPPAEPSRSAASTTPA